MSLISLLSALRSSSSRSMRSTRLRRRSAAMPPVSASVLSTTCNAISSAPIPTRAAGIAPHAPGGQWPFPGLRDCLVPGPFASQPMRDTLARRTAGPRRPPDSVSDPGPAVRRRQTTDEGAKPMKALTPEQVASYRYNGFLYPIPALTPDEVATCLAGLDRFEAALGSPVAAADTKWRSHAHAHSPWFNALIRHPRILDAVEDVIGPNILVWTSTFFIKEPRSPTFAAWHQDGTYFGLDPHEQVCAWVALTDASREAGCMEQLSSRGAARQLHHAPLGLANSINRAGQTIMEPFDEANPVAMALPAGSFSLHHEFAVHRSAPNNAAHRRVGIGLNF